MIKERSFRRLVKNNVVQLAIPIPEVAKQRESSSSDEIIDFGHG